MSDELKKELVLDASIMMSGDMWQKLYGIHNDFVWVTDTIKYWAKKFVDGLIERGFKGDGDDELDFVFELEKFEELQSLAS